MSRLMPIAALAAVVALAPPVALSASPESPNLRGIWKLEEPDKRGYIMLNLRYSLDGFDQGNWGRSMPFAAARGLRADAFRVPGPVSFEVVRGAGTFVCSGSMEKREGLGRFEFRPDPEYASTLERRGVGRPGAQQQLELALAGVEIALLDALDAAEYPEPSVERLIELGNHGVTHEYVLDLTTAGYKLGSLRQLREARDHGVTGSFARELKAAGFKDLDYDRVLEARDHGVTSDFIRELAGAGYTKLSYEQVLRARDHGVTGDYIEGLEAAGFRNIPFSSVVRARDHGLDERSARKARAALGSEATIDDAIEWRDRGGR
jgi:hypothetical protein